ncbi:MAG: hypothetical protein J6T57_02990 [Alphaproteobacteria bacterium]|nr:hypothetical protein [Alphaproteobacteria bacterium]
MQTIRLNYNPITGSEYVPVDMPYTTQALPRIQYNERTPMHNKPITPVFNRLYRLTEQKPSMFEQNIEPEKTISIETDEQTIQQTRIRRKRMQPVTRNDRHDINRSLHTLVKGIVNFNDLLDVNFESVKSNTFDDDTNVITTNPRREQKSKRMQMRRIRRRAQTAIQMVQSGNNDMTLPCFELPIPIRMLQELSANKR